MSQTAVLSESDPDLMNKPSTKTWTVLRPVVPETLQRMLLYQSKSAYYLLGYNGEETQCRLLTFPKRIQRGGGGSLSMVEEDPQELTPEEASQLLEQIHKQDASNGGGLDLLGEAFGILGCFRFLEGYYLFLITKRKPLGSLAGHTVYGIADTTLISLNSTNESWSERRYRRLLLSGVDLTKDFFFSYTYNLSYTVQHNLTHQETVDPFDSIYVWNEYLTRDLRTCLSDSKWLLPLVHGSWQQRNLSIFGRQVTLTLISRRSRRFAGTRYLKRGINQQGWVANEVETEQILSLQQRSHSGVPSLSSVVQLRGSIPLFWSQGTSALNPRPGILLHNMDPLYTATAKHFEDLFDRYGGPVVVQNLVKSVESAPRETILRREFAKAILFLNEHHFQDKIIHFPIDFKEKMRKSSNVFLTEIIPGVRRCLEWTGYCVVQPSMKTDLKSEESVKVKRQEGVSRSNCIDCLDRTNIWQFVYGLTALGHQLCSLGLLDSNDIDPNCSLAYQLMEMYEIMGNVIALQYGGSEAHGKFFERMRGRSEAATKSKELLTSLRRYYSNAISDREKQDAINLFLGHFIPCPSKPALWELGSDHFMHCGVDWNLNKTNFEAASVALKKGSSKALSSSDNSSLMRRSSTKSLSSIQLFPVPVISQTGHPESIPNSEQTNKNEGSKERNWSFRFWFRNGTKKTKEDNFQLPGNAESSLESFEQMQKMNPVFEVRLFDGQSSRNSKTGSQNSKTGLQNSKTGLQNSISGLQSSRTGLQDSRTGLQDSRTGLQDTRTGLQNSTSFQDFIKQDLAIHDTAAEFWTESSFNLQTSFSQQTMLPGSLDLSKERGSIESRLPVESLGARNQSCPRLESKSVSIERPVSRWPWFGALSRASTGTQRARQKSEAQRAASTPANVCLLTKEKTGVLDCPSKTPYQRLNPFEEFWHEYWSITEQSLTSELTLAEKFSISTTGKQKYSKSVKDDLLPSQSSPLNNTENSVFLDGLISQFLDDKPNSKGTEVKRRESTESEDPIKEEEVSISEFGSTQKPEELKSNINELLYSSSSSTGPGDRVLEKWFLADQKSETDYHKNLSLIVSAFN